MADTKPDESLTIQDQLLVNPNARPSELVRVEQWEGLPKDIELMDDKPFLKQVIQFMIKQDKCYDVCDWDPYGEGYDGGPNNIEDSWTKGGPVSTGSFEGVVLAEKAADALHAELMWLASGCNPSSPEHIMEEVPEWEPPRPQKAREENYINQIARIYGSLSDQGRKMALEKLQRNAR